jgi:lipid II:glycine glycyltransferase (peptidoglycan interpeptide bridge formation enzyme)
MTEVKQITEEDKVIFNQVAVHPVQSWEWGEFREKEGHRVIRLGLFDKEKPKEVFQLSLHKVPKTSFNIGYLPKCPLPSRELIKKLKEIGVENKVIFIKIEPHVETSPEYVKLLSDLGLIKVKDFFAKYTSIIDLSLSEEDLLKSFKPKTRYNIHLAQKHEVKIEEDNSDKTFSNYLNLTLETTKRQGFYAHSPRYHQLQWEILNPAGISHLLVAKYKGKILASFILFIFNKTLYYPYGASSREHKEVMAPTLLMWEAIRFGKAHGCKSFDLWGNADPNPSPSHPYYGFHKFKEGFSPKFVEFLGSYDLVINPFQYKVYRIVDKIRWKALRLKAKFLKN